MIAIKKQHKNDPTGTDARTVVCAQSTHSDVTDTSVDMSDFGEIIHQPNVDEPELITAVHRSDVDGVKACLHDPDCDVNASDGYERTALMIVVMIKATTSEEDVEILK